MKELTRIVTPDTEEAWVAKALGKSVREVEEMVSGHQIGDMPDDPKKPDLVWRPLRIDTPPDGHALWREVRKKCWEERGGETGDWEVLETALRAYLNPGTGEAGPVHQIAFKQCPDCKQATMNGAGRELDIAPGVFERAQCDARVIGSVDGETIEKAYSTVTPRMREQVFARDHVKCCVPGCRSSRNLDVHHIVFAAHGGKNEMSNLMLLCGGHHAFLHQGLMAVVGRAPNHLEFRWKYGPPMPVGIGPEERDKIMELKVAEILKHVPELVDVAPIDGPTWDVRAKDSQRELAYRERVSELNMRQRMRRLRPSRDVVDDDPFLPPPRRRRRRV